MLMFNDLFFIDNLSTKGYKLYVYILMLNDLILTDDLSTKGCNLYGYTLTLNDLKLTDGLSTKGCNLYGYTLACSMILNLLVVFQPGDVIYMVIPLHSMILKLT